MDLHQEFVRLEPVYREGTEGVGERPHPEPGRFPVRGPGHQHRREAGRGFVILEDGAADAPVASGHPARGRRREIPTSSSGVIRSRLPMPSVTSNLRVGLTPYDITGPRPRCTSEVCSRNLASEYAAEW